MRRCSLSGLGRRLRQRFPFWGTPSNRAVLVLLGAFLVSLFVQVRLVAPWLAETQRLRQETGGCGSGSRCMPGLLPGETDDTKARARRENALAWRQKLPDGMQGSALLTALSAEAVRCGVHLDLLRQKQPPVPDGTQTVVTLEGTGPYNGWLRFWKQVEEQGGMKGISRGSLRTAGRGHLTFRADLTAYSAPPVPKPKRKTGEEHADSK
jgi:hypothetical protein